MAEYHGYRDAHDEIVEWLRTDFEPAAQSADGPDDEAVVERMARAIYDSDRAEGNTPFTLDWDDWSPDSKPRQRYDNRARAALAALRGEDQP